jgi:hypothetical protein
VKHLSDCDIQIPIWSQYIKICRIQFGNTTYLFLQFEIIGCNLQFYWLDDCSTIDQMTVTTKIFRFFGMWGAGAGPKLSTQWADNCLYVRHFFCPKLVFRKMSTLKSLQVLNFPLFTARFDPESILNMVF